MSHKAQRDFCEQVKKHLPHYFKNATVLDVGSQDINGNNRWLFEDSAYLGCDVVEGRNVDFVGPCWALPRIASPFSVVISTEMLEHDPTWERSIKAMEERVAPGGLLLITCATTGRKIHNTEPGGYYGNLTLEQVVGALDKSKWEKIQATIEKTHHDVHLWAIKKFLSDA
jgi:hypothetical protein